MQPLQGEGLAVIGQLLQNSVADPVGFTANDLIAVVTVYIAVIRQEAFRRNSENQDDLLRAAQQRYKEKKAYMEEKP